MKKSYVRLLALAICAVMVLGLVPAKANAVALDGMKMKQMKSISVDDWGNYCFTNLSDLMELCAMAEQTSDFIGCMYDSNQTLTINQNLTIPENMIVDCYDATVRISSGVTVAVHGFAIANNLDIYGTVNVAENGGFQINKDINIHGQLNVEGFLSINGGKECEINGQENMNFGEYGRVTVYVETTDPATVLEFCKVAETAPAKWEYSIYVDEPWSYSHSITIPNNVNISAMEDMELTGDLLILGSLVANAPVYLNGQVTNYGYLGVNFDEGGRITIGKPEVYADADQNRGGSIGLYGQTLTNPADALYGISTDDFYYVESGSEGVNYWFMSSYKKNPSFHEHFYVSVPPIAPTCLTPGQTERIYCSECGEDLVSPEVLAALGHDYGLAADGKTPDFWDTTCDVCGAERVVDQFRPTHSMYRMYNPNTGEHFYTGDKGERQMLEAAGWKYEGVGFTFPASTGKPVYRLFQPSTGEHLYTMDEAEKAALLAQGWNFEGIAFNSGNENEVPQYRLYNPNVTVGAYHFTASMEERNVLLAAGWQDQGIGFYTCWQ